MRLHEGDLWLAALLDTIEKTRPTAFTGVPTLFNALINHPRVRAGKVDLSSIKVCFSGAAPLLAGYWDDPEETAATVRTADGERWLHTGDLGYLDGDGHLFIVDRVKDLIKTHGYQVWPREIEEVLASHPAVAEVGVAGVPDEARGEVAKAWVVLRPGQQAGAEELRAFCRERLAPSKVPATVEFRAGLPKSMVGKVLRRALTAEAEPAP